MKRSTVKQVIKFAAIPVAILVIGIFMYPQAKANDPTIPSTIGKQWRMVFSDEFNGKELDYEKWTTCYDWAQPEMGCTNAGNDEQQWYTKDQVSLSDGQIHFKAQVIDDEKYPYRSGMINSGQIYNRTYGLFEARIKTTSGQGVWPAFWLLPADRSWPPEIDVMEIVGHKPDEVFMTNHWGEVPNPQKDSTIWKGLQDPNGWHVYAAEWQPGKIEWYIDGVKRKTVESKYVPDQAMEIILNLAIGGRLPGKADPATLKSAQMDVDYVRVYESKIR